MSGVRFFQARGCPFCSSFKILSHICAVMFVRFSLKTFPYQQPQRYKNGPLEFKQSHHSFSRWLCETDSSLRWPSHGESSLDKFDKESGQIFLTRLKCAKLEAPLCDVMQFEKHRTLQA